MSRNLRDGRASVRETVHSYLATNLEVDATARGLFTHRNTIRYRLRRFVGCTGADLSDTETILEVW